MQPSSMSHIPTTTKEVGSRVRLASLPSEGLRTGLKLRRTARLLGKWIPERGFIIRGRTAEEAEARWVRHVESLASNR
jgi:hypothetical protein